MLSVRKVLEILTRDFVADQHRAEKDRRSKADVAWDSYQRAADTGAATHDAERMETATIVQAMIAAAAADGRIDAEERRKILARLDAADLTPGERAEIERTFTAPMPIYALAQSVGTPEHAKAVYAGAVAAIVVDTPEETAFLRSLRDRLNLSAETIASIHGRFGLIET